MSAPGLSPPPSKLEHAISWTAGGRVLGPVASFLERMMVVAGPWLISITALAVISVTFEPILGRSGIEDLSLTVIYALCLAPLTAGPIGAVVARLLNESVEAGDGEGKIASLTLIGLVVAGSGAAGLALLAGLALPIADGGLLVAFLFLTVASAQLWVCLAILAALRAYGFLMAAFTAGIALSVCAMVFTARATPSIDFLVWSFSAGLFFFVTLSTGRVVGRVWPESEQLSDAWVIFWHALVRQRFLVLGILFAFLAVWVDKWVFWFGPEGFVSNAGFRHFGYYDSVMFLAHLSILPTFAAMSVFHDGPLTRAVEDLRARLHARANHESVRASVADLGATVWSGVIRIGFVQGIVTVAAILTAPMAARLLDFDITQFFLVRIGFVAVFLHATIYLLGAVLIMSGRIRVFCAIQGLHLAANLFFSVLSYVTVGVSAFGFFAASLAVVPVAFAAAHIALSRYLYFLLVGENESLYIRQ